MKNFTYLLLAVALASCGDDGNKTPDASPVHDGTPQIDAAMFPAAPSIGPQIDRMGRPAISTALDHAFDSNATTAGAAKDAYNQDQAMGDWPTTYAAQFSANLAIIDSLDTGLTCTLGDCGGETTGYAGDGCGNQALYNGMTGGQAGHCSTTTTQGCAITSQCPTSETCVGPVATSYGALASILADDELALDTSKSMCRAYLAVEFDAVTMSGHTDCGGRAPSNDVMDTTYTVAAIGIQGFSQAFVPAFQDGVSAHTDVDDATFPFLGAPH